MLTLYIADVERDAGMKSLSRKEAAEVLEDMKVKIEIPKAAVTQWKRNTALDMAIEALKYSEFPNTSDFVSRKAVREMVATWSYDMAEWEDVELALHDVDELPSVQPEVIHCKDCKHYRTIGAFGVPLHKEEYFCDADNYPKNDPGEEQRKLPEWWFCAGAERKDNKYILDCQTCDLENPSGFKMRDRFTTVPKDVYEKMQMDDLREEQEERLGVAPILNPKTT